MPRSSGTYSLPAGNPVVTGTTISSTTHNSTLSDIATELTNSIPRDGQAAPTANIPMGNYKFTGLGAGSSRTDSANLGQIQDSAYLWLTSVSGADTITATVAPNMTAYASGQSFWFVSAGANSGAVTININSIGAKAITKNGTTVLEAGDIPSGAVCQITYDGTQFQLLNTYLPRATPVQVVGMYESAVVTASGLEYVVDPWGLHNLTLSVSVAGNAMTIAIKGADGNDPSVSNPVTVGFRSSTLSSGRYYYRYLTGATSMTISSGSTIGTVSGQAHRLYIVLVDDGTSFSIGIWNPWNDTNKDLLGIYEDTVYSSTAEGGAGAADSAQVLYTDSAVTSKAVRVIGYIEGSQATAGTWASSPTKVHVCTPGTPKTGDIVQRVSNLTSAYATGSTVMPDDDTTPLYNEGNQYLQKAITCRSSANLIAARASLIFGASAATKITTALFNTTGATDAAIAAQMDDVRVALANTTTILDHQWIANSGSSITVTVRSGVDGSGAGTMYLNGYSGARKLGGIAASGLVLTEIHV